MSKIVGIDEVGRGPLAGPVTVCVVVCDKAVYKKLSQSKELPPLGKDSKKLTHKDRVRYDTVLRSLAKAGKISFTIQSQSNKTIDTKGISFCIKKSIETGLKKLKVPLEADIRLDGGLKAPKEFKKQTTIIKGDEKERIIAWASIIAKVHRDAYMCKCAKRLSQYGFEKHKGYGTLTHRKAIHQYKLSDIHRVSFCGNILDVVSRA